MECCRALTCSLVQGRRPKCKGHPWPDGPTQQIHPLRLQAARIQPVGLPRLKEDQAAPGPHQHICVGHIFGDDVQEVGHLGGVLGAKGGAEQQAVLPGLCLKPAAC